jgi:saccharopine dehydrogenase-like NADP-dependent oxidoreductase
MAMKVLVLGAGRVGGLIAAMLAKTGDFAVSVADSSEEQLRRFDGAPFGAFWLDAGNVRTIDEAMDGVDTVINACPPDVHLVIARAARKNGLNYFDLSEDSKSLRDIKAIAKDAKAAFVPQCGVSPGFVSIVTRDLARRLDPPLDIGVRVGALPRYPTNRLKYGLTWNTDGLFGEYTEPCEAIRNSKRVGIEPLGEREEISLDGQPYEAFTTANGLGTLCETTEGEVRNLTFKTLRYPGHLELIRFLMDDLGMRHRRDLFKTVFENGLPRIHQDVVLIFITVSGRRGLRVVQESYVKKLYAENDEDSALQTASAAALCTMVDLLRGGAVTRTGYVRQEDVDLATFTGNRFGRYFV